MTTQPALDPDLICGTVIAPEDAGWDAARAAWNLLADQRPALVVQAADAGDVVEAVRFARARGLRVAAQSTGHGAAALGSLAGAVLIRTARMNDVAVDPGAQVARAGAGARWSDVIAAAAPHGLAGLHGFSAGVGVAGYVLGGGLGWLARSHGLASDRVRSFEVVTADGERLRVDTRREPDLFWALRGGGGAGVIVTSFELELVALREAYAGVLMWPIERAGEVAHAYREWTRTVPDALTSSLRLMHFPPLPELPEVLRGRALAQLTLAFLGNEREGDALIAPLRALSPEIDHVGIVPAAALGEIAGDPVDPVPDRSRSRLLASLTPDVVDKLVALARPAVTVMEIRHLGGALRNPANPGAAGALDAEALVFASGVPAAHPQELDETLAALDTLGPAADRDTLLTFAGPGDQGLPAAALDRLGVITAAHDPDRVVVEAELDRHLRP
ncbi:MAG TPA: FAD-binding oxidoreductase [Solirubrobacteraceae bacterium]|nr:FAD-binding oxidoreductase [Solirubrobacteraceae bacterium]